MNLIGGLHAMLRCSSWDRERLRDYQSRRLRAVVRNAYGRVPYYRRLFDAAGLKPEEVRGVEDLQRIPITSREEVQALDPVDILAEGVDPSRLRLHKSSGSSGRPLTVYRSPGEMRLARFNHWRMYRALGNSVTDRRATIRFDRSGRSDAHQEWRNYRKLGLYPMELISVLLPAREILDRLCAYRPDIVISHPSSLSWVAGEMSAADREVLKPRFVLSWGETLTPNTRREIGEGFQAPVYDYYGTAEFHCVAWQCLESKRYHVRDEVVIVEVVRRDGRPAGPGEEGELVGTALNSFTMPFLRYRIGDRVVRGPEQCPCGAPFSTLLSIEGRTLDRYILPDGREIHPYRFARCLVDGPVAVRRFQIVQQRRDFFHVRIVPKGDPPAEALERLRSLLAEELAEGVEVELERVAEIAPSSTGKFYPYVSLERLRAWRNAGGRTKTEPLP